MSTQIVAREMNSEASASLTQAMNGNNISETKKVGHHLVKRLVKSSKLAKLYIVKLAKLVMASVTIVVPKVGSEIHRGSYGGPNYDYLRVCV
ncbi:hypothetical protein P3S67_028210 [Capsicum chacoense]